MPRFCWMWLCPIVACRSLSQLVLPKFGAGPRQTSAATLRTTKHYWSSPRRWLFPQHYNTLLKLLQLHQIQIVLHLLLLLDLAQFQAAKSTAPDAAGVSPVHHLVGLTVVAFGSPHFPGIWLCLSMSFFLAEHFIKMGTISYKRMMVWIEYRLVWLATFPLEIIPSQIGPNICSMQT